MSYWFFVVQAALTGNFFISEALVSLLVFYGFCSTNLAFL